MNYPHWFLRRLLLIRISKGDPEQVEEVLSWGASPHEETKKGTPAICLSVRAMCPHHGVVLALLKAGADPQARSADGLTTLDRARRRLLKYEGKPRKPPRRSPSLTPGGELRLHPREWKFIEEIERDDPNAAEEYLMVRRKVAERVFDPRGELEKIVGILEAIGRSGT